MLRRLLVALDQMPSSRRAQSLATRLAYDHKATIVGLAIVDPYWANRAEVYMGQHEAHAFLPGWKKRRSTPVLHVRPASGKRNPPRPSSRRRPLLIYLY